MQAACSARALSFLDAVLERRLHRARRRLRRLRGRPASRWPTAGYSGWLICEAEQDPAKAHPLTYAKKGYATIKATAEKVGLQLA